jgi:hypothetical protein
MIISIIIYLIPSSSVFLRQLKIPRLYAALPACGNAYDLKSGGAQ